MYRECSGLLQKAGKACSLTLLGYLAVSENQTDKDILIEENYTNVTEFIHVHRSLHKGVKTWKESSVFFGPRNNKFVKN